MSSVDLLNYLNLLRGSSFNFLISSVIGFLFFMTTFFLGSRSGTVVWNALIFLFSMSVTFFFLINSRLSRFLRNWFMLAARLDVFVLFPGSPEIVKYCSCKIYDRSMRLTDTSLFIFNSNSTSSQLRSFSGVLYLFESESEP